jgi:hypothetical protein
MGRIYNEPLGCQEIRWKRQKKERKRNPEKDLR